MSIFGSFLEGCFPVKKETDDVQETNKKCNEIRSLIFNKFGQEHSQMQIQNVGVKLEDGVLVITLPEIQETLESILRDVEDWVRGSAQEMDLEFESIKIRHSAEEENEENK